MTLSKRFFVYLTVFLFILGIKDSFAQTLIGQNPCPEENAKNRGVLEEYLTKDHWDPNRQETNTDHLTTSQISVLQSPKDDTVCAQFNNQYEEAFTEEWKSGGKKYDVTYFKVGDYFFVLITLKTPEDSNVAGTGIDFIHVYNSNINLIEAYAF